MWPSTILLKKMPNRGLEKITQSILSWNCITEALYLLLVRKVWWSEPNFIQRKLGMDPVTTQDWLVSIKSPLVLLNSDSADTHVSSIVLSDSDSADTQVSKESSPLLIPASRCSGTVDSTEELQDSWIELDPRTSIFLDVILILLYITWIG